MGRQIFVWRMVSSGIILITMMSCSLFKVVTPTPAVPENAGGETQAAKTLEQTLSKTFTEQLAQPKDVQQKDVDQAEADLNAQVREPLRSALGDQADKLLGQIDQTARGAIQNAVGGQSRTPAVIQLVSSHPQSGTTPGGVFSAGENQLNAVANSANAQETLPPVSGTFEEGGIKGDVNISGARDKDLTDAKIELKIAATGKSGGTLLQNLSLSSSGLFQGKQCPDANGVVTFDFSAKVSISAKLGEEDLGGSNSLKAHVLAHVNDEANLTSMEADLDVEASRQNTQAASTQSKYQYLQYQVGYAWTGMEPGAKPGVTITGAKGLRGSSQLSGSYMDEVIKTNREAAYKLALYFLYDAQQRWQNGYCVEVLTDEIEETNMVSTGSTTDFKGRVRHKFEGNDLGVPLQATLSGKQNLDPNGKQTAPVDYAYKAPEQKDSTATIEFETRSKRGIAKAARTFIISSPGYSAYVPAGYSGSACIPGPAFTIEYKQTLGVNLKGSFRFTPSGPDSTSGTVTWEFGGKVGDSSQAVKGKGTYTGQTNGNQLELQISGKQTTTVTAGGVSTSVDQPNSKYTIRMDTDPTLKCR